MFQKDLLMNLSKRLTNLTNPHMNELTELNRGFLNSNNNKHRCTFNVGYAVSVYSKQFYKIKKYSFKVQSATVCKMKQKFILSRLLLFLMS